MTRQARVTLVPYGGGACNVGTELSKPPFKKRKRQKNAQANENLLHNSTAPTAFESAARV